LTDFSGFSKNFSAHGKQGFLQGFSFNINQKQKGIVMIQHDRACFEMFKRANDFGTVNAADFTGADVVSTKTRALFTELTGVITQLTAATSGQVGGTGAVRAGTTGKSVQRENLLATMRGIHKSAAAIALSQQKPEIMDSFRLSDGHNDTMLTANATAFGIAAAPLQSAFVELGHAATFVQDLNNQVAAFNAADSTQGTAAQARSGATNSFGPLIHEGLMVVRQLDAIMHNKYASNAEKTGEWTTASHIERSGGSSKPQPQAAKPATATA
jgi:hypothetical protein